ncbi:hypothetical protein [Streptomyces sp. NPDC013489]|uniref:hypothetical protein n=1 Tax=Streptomyces sp. NPDC013489 TaxID=3155606 RepID=UPI00340D5B2C
MYEPNPPQYPPALIEVLAVWGWSVEHGGIPLDYAATVVADHECYTDPSSTGVEDATAEERHVWAAEDLSDWENVVARMAWPGNDAVDRERWDQPGDWEMREYLLKRLGITASCENTDRLLLRHCDEQIAACERELADQPADTNATDEGN